jgi:exodeoxyribonuclease VII small subunit
MNKGPTYTEAFNELQQIVSDMEQGDITVDELTEKIKRAIQLIKICCTKLSTVEEDVQKILRELESHES